MKGTDKTYLTGEQTEFLKLINGLQDHGILLHGWGTTIKQIIKKGYYLDSELKALNEARSNYIIKQGKDLIMSDMEQLGDEPLTKILYSVGSRTFSLYKNAEEYSNKTGQRIIQHLI